MEMSNSWLGLVLVTGFGLIGSAFAFHFWRYDSLTVSHGTELPVSPDDAAALSAVAMTAVGVRMVSVDSTGRSLAGHTRMTLRSLGTRCRVDVSPTPDGSFLECRCWPRAELVLTDWGAGRKVLDALVAEVDRHDTSTAAPVPV
jgi:hypothetical protein